MLACKYVDDVIIDPPYKITAEFIKQMNITAVVTGKKTESQLDQDRSAMEEHDEGTTLYLFLFIFFFFFFFFIFLFGTTNNVSSDFSYCL